MLQGRFLVEVETGSLKWKEFMFCVWPVGYSVCSVHKCVHHPAGLGYGTKGCGSFTCVLFVKKVKMLLVCWQVHVHAPHGLQVLYVTHDT